MSFANAYRGKRVLITGHTGFKGSWLSEWLLLLGAEVTGLALAPITKPALFEQLGLSVRLRHIVGDVRDLATVRQAVETSRPDFVFHLAAQPLVRLSYDQPVETYATNVMGTVNVLEALRCLQGESKADSSSLSGTNPSTGAGDSTSSRTPIVAVMITTDKCYENKEWVHSYREDDPMGGYDPYSSSKGAAELVITAYRRSYFGTQHSTVSRQPVIRLASVRAGNVIGGGDWALDRIFPDCMRALQRGEAIPVRNKIATRPWQHVLEPLSGYLWLGAVLHDPRAWAPKFPPSSYSSAFNFGPALTSNRTVAELVQEVLKHWPGRWEDHGDPHAVHEASLLNLSTDKAFHILGWRPVWGFEQTIMQTVDSYRQLLSPSYTASAAILRQIEDYSAAAGALGLAWAMESAQTLQM